METSLDLVPEAHRAQMDFANCRDVPYIGFVGGRGAGKSSAAALRLMLLGIQEPGPYGMYAPTYPLLHDTIMPCFQKMAAPIIRETKGNPPNITLLNGTDILCRSLDDPERARGPSLRGAVWDEASLCDKTAFDILIACLRYEGKQGWLACTFTPKGPAHWTADVFNNPARTDVRCFHAATYANPFNPAGFADTLRRQYTTVYSQQEIEGRFVSLSGGLFRRDWFKVIPQAPADLRRVCRFWDMAATPKTEDSPDPDWTAGIKLGVKDGQWYILDLQHARLTPSGNKDLVYTTMILDGPEVMCRMEEEGGSSGKSLVDMYRREVFIGRDFDGIRPTGDKMLRAQPFAAAAEAGNVFLVAAPWNKILLDEMEAFSPECQHDDIVDACAGAMGAIRDKLGFNSISFMRYQSPLDNTVRKLEDTLRKAYTAITDPAEKLEAAKEMRNAGFTV